MSECYFCKKMMMKKRFPTEFVFDLGGDTRTENVFSCRACRTSIKSKGYVKFPSYTRPIKVLSVYEPDGLSKPKTEHKTERKTPHEIVFHIHTPPPVGQNHYNPKDYHVEPIYVKALREPVPQTILALLKTRQQPKAQDQTLKAA